MINRNHLNLLLLLILLVLVGMVFWSSQPTTPVPSQNKPLAIDVQHLQQIIVERQGYPTITLQRHQEQWWLQHPHLPAKASLIDAILSLPSVRRHTSYPVQQLDTTKLGLSNPTLCIHYDSQRLCFGSQNPLDQLRYIQLGEEVHMIYDTLSHQLSGEFQDYLSNHLLPTDASIEKLLLPQLSIEKTQQTWQLLPTSVQASHQQIQQLLNNWQQAQALLITPYQNMEAEEEIEITLQGGNTIRFILVSSEPELILARPEFNVQYHLPEGNLQRLTRLPSLDEPQ